MSIVKRNVALPKYWRLGVGTGTCITVVGPGNVSIETDMSSDDSEPPGVRWGRAAARVRRTARAANSTSTRHICRLGE